MADAVVVLDSGSCSIRAGYANAEDKPPVIVPSVTADQNAGEVVSAFGRGNVISWPAAEALWDWSLYEALGWVESEEGSVLFAEPAGGIARHDRERVAQLFFETFNVAGLFCADAAVLALYAVNRLSGTSIAVGDTLTSVCPVIEGAAVASMRVNLPFGGRDITALLARTLRTEMGVRSIEDSTSKSEFFTLAAEGDILDAATISSEGFKLANQIKEEHIRVSRSRSQYQSQAANAESQTYELPDGTVLDIGPATAKAGEAIVDPGILGHTSKTVPSIPEAVIQALTYSSLEYRRTLLENLVVHGGGSAVSGLDERIVAEVNASAPGSSRVSTVRAPDYMPDCCLQHATWLGGAILSKVVYSQSQQLTKHEYDEQGPYAVHKRCA